MVTNIEIRCRRAMVYHIQFQLSNPLPSAHNPNMHVQQRHMRDRRHYLFPNRPPQTDIQIAASHAPRAAFRPLALYQVVSLSSLTPIATIEPSLFSPEICHVSVNISQSATTNKHTNCSTARAACCIQITSPLSGSQALLSDSNRNDRAFPF